MKGIGQRTRPEIEKAEPSGPRCTILYQLGPHRSIEEMHDFFPVDASMRGVPGFIPDTPESARAKQARLLG